MCSQSLYLYLFSFTSNLRALDANLTVGVIFIDFKKAFDNSVSHNVLLKKIAASGISGDLYDYITLHYISNRSQHTVVNGKQSELLPVKYGVPQGSLLVPLCFTMNVDDMPNTRHCDKQFTNLSE